jgi:hypothetical protein
MLKEIGSSPHRKMDGFFLRVRAGSIPAVSQQHAIPTDRLYENGRPPTKEQLAEAPRYTGTFVIEDWPQGWTFGRFIRQARLKRAPMEGNNDIIAPLFDPVCVKVDNYRMIFSGYVINTDKDLQPVHYAQSWVLRPADHSNLG